MPVLVNKSTGLAEDVASPDEVLAAGTHAVPLYDPEGNAVAHSPDEASELLAQGYSQPTPQELASMLKTAKYSSTGQQIATGLEGAAAGVAGPLAPMAETALGIATPEEMLARRETNPGTYAAGQAAGFVGSIASGTGLGSAVVKGGAKVAEKLSAHLGSSFAGKVGTSLTRNALEGIAMQTADEAGKLFLQDPDQSMQTAVTNIGLSGLLGAAIGGGATAVGQGTKALWGMGPGKRVEALLTAVKNRSAGVPDDLKKTAQLDLTPELNAALSDDPVARLEFQTLMESNSSTGMKMQQQLEAFKANSDEALTKVLGKTPEDALSVSDYEVGKVAQDKLVRRIKEIADPIKKEYDAIDKTFSKAPFDAEAKALTINSLTEKANMEGWLKAPSSPENKLFQRVLSELDLQQTAQDLRKYASNLRSSSPYGTDSYRAAKLISETLEDAQEGAIINRMSLEAPDLLQGYTQTKASYKQMKGLIEDLNDRLHAGRGATAGSGSFSQAIREMAPEDLIKRLSAKGDVGMQKLLTDNFPELAEMSKQYELNKILKMSGNVDGAIDFKKLDKQIAKLSPEEKAFIFTPEQLDQIQAISELRARIPAKMNGSGTAKTLDKLWAHAPASAAGIGGLLTGGLDGGVAGLVLGTLARYVGKEAPDAVRMSMLKYLGSSEPVSAEGFKAMVKTANAVIEGEKRLTKSVGNVFFMNQYTQPAASEKTIERLKKAVDKVAENPETMLEMEADAGHYLPDHAASGAMTALGAIQYLASLKPDTTPVGPLDPPRVPNSFEQARYRNALEIAENPLSVLESVKNGTITTNEIQDLSSMYPALYSRMKSKLLEGLVNLKTEKSLVPYKTRLSMAMFLAMPLDASMSPQSIMSAQVVPSMQAQQLQAPRPNSNKLSKLASSYQTSTQTGEKYRSSRH
jgi:hypothetical protein